MACEKVNKFVNVLSIWEEAERCASGAAKSRSEARAEAVGGRLHAFVRPRCASDARSARSPLAPGRSRLRDTPEHMHSPAPAHAGDARDVNCMSSPKTPCPCARGRRAWQGGGGWDRGPRPLGTGETRVCRRETVSTVPPTPCARERHAPRSAGQGPVPPHHLRTWEGHQWRLPGPRPLPPATPCGCLTPGTDADDGTVGGQTVEERPHGPAPAHAWRTGTSPYDGGTDPLGPPPRAPPDSAHARENLRRQRAVRSPERHALHTSVAQGTCTGASRHRAAQTGHGVRAGGATVHPTSALLATARGGDARPRRRVWEDGLRPSHLW